MNKILSNIYDYVPLSIKSYIKYLVPKSFYSKRIFSQCGEDLIIKELCKHICKEKNIKYLDIGANHPFSLSNTALLYFNNKPNGGGVLVEPNPEMAMLLKARRSSDHVLNAGVSSTGCEEELPFYVMDLHVLSTFSKVEADQYVKMGHEIIEVLIIKTVNINDIFKEYFSDGEIDFLNIDTEGLDFDILKTIDFKSYIPKVVCVETVDYRPTGKQKKQNDILKFLQSKGYVVYGETGLNTIFVKQNVLNE